jgi:hypothetical protein
MFQAKQLCFMPKTISEGRMSGGEEPGSATFRPELHPMEWQGGKAMVAIRQPVT